MKKRINYTMTAPLSHIGETASAGSYFQTVLTSEGRLPVITGNAIRGQLRDACALHLLRVLDNPKVDKDAFNVLFSGGNIVGGMKDDVAKARAVRQHFPMISLLGGGLGDMIMSGKLLCGFAYPVCREAEAITGVESPISWHSLIDEIEFTRTDDGKNDKLSGYLLDAGEEKSAKASTQMRYSVQYIAAGAEFAQDLMFLPGATELEMGAFYAGLREWWFNVPRLGGMAGKGFGFFNGAISDEMRVAGDERFVGDEVSALIGAYEDFVRGEGAQYLPLLSVKKGGGKSGKTADKTA